MSTVTITAQKAKKKDGSKNPNAGQVFTQTVNPDGTPHLDKNGQEHGYIRVESKELNLGFAYAKATKSRSVLIGMTKEAFETDREMMTNGTKIKGQIIRIDAVTPFYEGQKPLQAPKRDAEGNTIEGEFVDITSQGLPVYRDEKYTKNLELQDEPLAEYDVINETVKASASKATILSK